MNQAEIKPAKKRSILRRLVWGFVIVLGICLIVGGATAGWAWYYFFGQQADPIAQVELETEQIEEAPIDKTWHQARKLVRESNAELKKLKSIRCDLYKQERIDGRLEPINHLEFKQTADPSRIYLKWVEPFAGREIIFELKKRGNRMLIHEGDPLRRITPDLIMPTDHILAQKFSLHPVTDLRVQIIRRDLRLYMEAAEGYESREVVVTDEQDLRGKLCHRIVIKFPDPEDCPEEYCRFDLFIEQETMYPLRWELYQWGPDGEEQLLEYYEIANLEPDVELTDEDFDPKNPNYNFRPDWVSDIRPKDKEEK